MEDLIKKWVGKKAKVKDYLHFALEEHNNTNSNDKYYDNVRKNFCNKEGTIVMVRENKYNNVRYEVLCGSTLARFREEDLILPTSEVT